MSATSLIGKIQRLQRLQANLAKGRQRSPTDSLDALTKRYADDFLGFTALLKVQPKEGGGRIPFVLTPLQAQLHEERTSRMVCLKGRQIFVTTLECARDLWWFLTKRGARVVVVVQSDSDHVPLRDVAYKIRLFIDSLRERGYDLKFGAEALGEWTLPERDSTLRVIQAGASDAAAQKKGRAGTVNRCHVTEPSVFEYADVMWRALEPSIAEPHKGSEIIIEGTARGASGWYFEQWRAAVEGRSEYKPVFLKWWKHPEYSTARDPGEIINPRDGAEERLVAGGATPENIKWWRRKVATKGLDDCLQEYPTDPDTCFLLSGRGFFDLEVVGRLLARANERTVATHALKRAGAVGWIKIWERPEHGKSYLIAADTSAGEGGDFSAAHVYEFATGRHMATLHGQVQPYELAGELVRLSRAYGNAWVVVERNMHGAAVFVALERTHGYGPRIWRDRDQKYGWLTNELTRQPALDALEDAIRRGDYTTRDKHVLSEIQTFIVNKRGRPEAAPGAHDDHVMTAAIGWNALGRPVARRDLTNLPPA